MAIRVTCSQCMSRFDVSEKFAGREGPCPKCKATIRIPSAAETVTIHAPESAGPKDSRGRPVLRPIRRRETVLSPVQIVAIALTVAGFLAGSLLLREFFPDPATMPWWIIPAILTGLAPACVLGAYSFLRDQERGAFAGRELWVRVAICAAIYSLLWLTLLAGRYAFGGYGLGAGLTSSIIMLGIGSAVATLVLELDWFIALAHYGLYFGCALLLRLAAGVGAFPVEPDGGPAGPAPVVPVVPLGWLEWVANGAAAWLGGA